MTTEIDSNSSVEGSVSLREHEEALRVLHGQVRELILENEHLRRSLIELREQGDVVYATTPPSESPP